MKLDELVFSKQQGLLPVIVTDVETKEVLMLAYMNKESLKKTLASGQMWYWSRSRQELWHKGATSGHFQYLQELKVDCDADTLLAVVKQIGVACHTGEHSCFYRTLVDERGNNHDNT